MKTVFKNDKFAVSVDEELEVVRITKIKSGGGSVVDIRPQLDGDIRIDSVRGKFLVNTSGPITLVE